VDTAHSINFFTSPQYSPSGLLTGAIHGVTTGWNAITLATTFNNRLHGDNYLLIEGKLQNIDSVITVKARRILPLEISRAATQSHDFH
jgi:hypothetical protein